MKENWGFWLPRLPRHWHLLVPDLPGLGESDYQVDANYGYEAQARRSGTGSPAYPPTTCT
ncbi:alpha/beta fold hydrolase [Marinobacter similis]|uniref:alpha/beta fold hydrolase n=1 Tax=Marinobacter similis TaxID=1420916 RepID=UPI000A4A8309|nr:hypothetical protein [Marinobacter similis]